MKPNLLNKAWIGIALISLSMMSASCEYLPKGAPTGGRKKMPGFYDNLQQSNGMNSKGYSSCGMGSDAGLINLDTDYISIPLIDSDLDASIFAMVDVFKPLASSYLSEWASQQNKGVILDLRSSHSGSSTREEYRLENGNQSVPVVFVWNATSALRAKRFTSILNDLPGINSTKINK